MARRSIVRLLERCLKSVPAPCSKLRREIREELDLIRSGKTIYNERCSTCEGELKIAVQVCDSLTCRTLASLRADAEANHG